MAATRFGPEERRLLETTAGEIFGKAVASGHLLVDDPSLDDDEKVQPALNLLLDLGLLELDDEGGRYFPNDPTDIQSRVVVPLGQKGSELLAESASWAHTFGTLRQVYRKSSRPSSGAVTQIRGFSQINDYIQAAVDDCRSELLTAQPHGRRPSSELAVAIQRDIDALNRGIRMRTLYQHSARQSPATREYVAEVTQHGAEVRTLDEFFERLIVVDRNVAIIPSAAGDQVAVAIHDRSLIHYLVDIFERAWERGYPFTAHDARNERAVASDVRAMTIRLLVEGHSDPASAKRLGVSTRTYAGYIASLKEEYGVQTRFQLGYAMGREVGRTDPTEPDAF